MTTFTPSTWRARMALFRTFDEIMGRRQNLLKRTVQTTVLVVGEGDTEKAFLDYLKSLYVSRGCGVSVTVRNAHGKGPMNVVDTAIRQSRTGEYKVVAVLMDTDLPWTDEVIKLARKHRLCLIGATPCSDGLLLQILGEQVPEQSLRCKEALHARMKRRPFVKEAYAQDFPKQLLDEKSVAILALKKLLDLMAGLSPKSDR